MIPKELQIALESRYNIIGNIEFKQFDHDWGHLRNFFETTKKENFTNNDRYVIEHQDTDIYVKEMSVGVNFRNLFQIITELDIPFYTIIIWTNHYGLQKEIDLMCQHQHVKDRPTLIESFCTNTHTTEYYRDVPINIDHIQHHALSMIGANRSHRFALYNALKHVDAQKLAISIQGLIK